MALEKKSNDWKEFLELESAEVPETPFVVKRIVKRDGSIEKYDRYKIASAIGRAVSAVQGMEDKDLTDRLTEKTEEKLRQFMSGRHPNSAPAVEEIQDLVEEVMMENGPKIAKAYILYRRQREKVRIIPIEYIDDFPDHPFKVVDDESMEKLMNSIEEIGVQTPIVARIKEDKRYEIISGHRRVHACKRLGVETLPVIVRELTRDEAIISMVDSNLQREHILPSEKAMAYKMKLEAMNRQGKRTDLTSTPVVSKLRTNEQVGEENGESREQVRRYIRLTELIPELLEMVDEESIAFRPAVELSYLTEEEQNNLLETISSEEATPSLAQAIRMKQLSREGKLDMDTIFSIMTETKPNQVETIKFKSKELSQYFPANTPPEAMRKLIFRLLDIWQKSKEKKEPVTTGAKQGEAR